MGQYIKDVEALEVSKIIKEHVTNTDSSRSVVYRELNPMLSLHPIYHSGVCETYRVDTTRLRLSSHRLKIGQASGQEFPVRNVYAYIEIGISNQNPTFLFIVNIPET